MERAYNVIIIAFPNFTYNVSIVEYSLLLSLRSLGCVVTYMPHDDFIRLNEQGVNPSEHPLINECDFFICVNNCVTWSSIFDRLDKPLVSICVDRPFHMKWSFNNTATNVLYLWSDENDVKYAPEYFRSGIHRFLPHAAEIYPPPEDGLLLKKRAIGVLVSSNFAGKNNEMMNADSIDGADAIAKRYLEGDARLEDCVRDVTQWGDAALFAFMREKGGVIDARARNKKKYEIYKALVKSGLPINCCGLGWEESDLMGYANFMHQGVIPYPVFLQLLQNTKVIVNVFPVFNASTHERVLGAMMRGALCVTDPTDWLKARFTDGESIVFYDPAHKDDIAEKIAFYLNNENERLRVTQNAMETALREHTWLSRAGQLLDIYEALI